MKDSIVSNIKLILLNDQKKLKINPFQIDNMKINKIFVNDKLIDKRVEYFSEINEKIIQEKITPEFKFEIELVQFGKCNFSEEREANVFQKKGEIRTRYFDEDGNIFFLLNGIFQIFFYLHN